MTVNTSAISAEPSIEPSVAGVWDRLWQNGSSSTKDDENPRPRAPRTTLADHP